MKADELYITQTKVVEQTQVVKQVREIATCKVCNVELSGGWYSAREHIRDHHTALPRMSGDLFFLDSEAQGEIFVYFYRGAYDILEYVGPGWYGQSLYKRTDIDGDEDTVWMHVDALINERLARIGEDSDYLKVLREVKEAP